MKGTGIILQFFGLFAIIPFKAEYLQFWDLPFYSISGIGVLLLLRATQKIGWRLNLENNILYYSKFNYYSSWKKRRSNEFALSIEKITKVEMDGKDFVISYNQSKKLRFNTSGLSSLACLRLEKLKTELESDIVRRINA
jgi:hypothetical protein